MTRRPWPLLLLLFAIGSAPSVAAPRPSIALTGRVVDAANILDPATERYVSGLSATLERRTGHQLVVATVPSLGGQSVKRYSLALFSGWGIGRRCCNDGVGLLVAPREHRVRIEVGTGLEPILTDNKAKAIIERTILPAFRDGDMSLGIRRGTKAIAPELQPS